MMVEVKRIGVLRAGLFLAMLYLFCAIVFLPFFLIAVIADLEAGWPMLLIFVAYPVMGFFGGIIGALLYNLTAKIVGGMILEMKGEVAQPLPVQV